MTERPRGTLMAGVASDIGRAVSDLLAGRGKSPVRADLHGTRVAANLADDPVLHAVALRLRTNPPQIETAIHYAGVSLPEDGTRAISGQPRLRHPALD